jgi:hypothetical protein
LHVQLHGGFLYSSMPPDGARTRTPSFSLPRTIEGVGSVGRFFGVGVRPGVDAGSAAAGAAGADDAARGFEVFGAEAGSAGAEAAFATSGFDAA